MDSSRNLWKPEYVLNIEIIDEQHKGFFEICAKAAQLCEAAKVKPVKISEIIHILYKLRCYAFMHFHTEETLFLKYNHPRIFDHFVVHDTYLQSLQGFTAELQKFVAQGDKAASEEFLAYVEQISDYVVDWWREHILGVDREYIQYVRERRGRTA